MKKSAILLLAIAPFALTLSGCVVKVGGDDQGYSFNSDYEDREMKNRNKINNLTVNTAIMRPSAFSA